jgi:hypothetical protein
MGAIDDAIETVGESVERGKEIAQTGKGIAAVAGYISEEKQKKLDQGMDLFEEVGRRIKREERMASRQVNELANEVGGAVSLFTDAILDPDGFWEGLKKKGSDT